MGLWEECEGPAVGVEVGEDAQHEVAQLQRVKGGGHQNVVAPRQRAAQEHGPGVDVGGRGHRLLGQNLVQAVLPVELHLVDEGGRGHCEALVSRSRTHEVNGSFGASDRGTSRTAVSKL